MEPAGILLLFTFPVGPLLLGFYAWRITRQNPSPPSSIGPSLWPGILNSSLCFALAFNLVYFVQEFFLAWPKSLLPGVSALVYHNNHNWSGSHPDILLYQGAGALAIIALGVSLSIIGYFKGNRLPRWHALLWWTACLAIALGLIQVSIAAMHPDNDVGQAFEFLKLSDATRLLLATASSVTAIAFGVYFTRPLLAMAPEGAVESARARVVYVLKFAILPLLIGTVLSWANRAPSIGQLTMPLFSALFVLPWTLAAAALVPAPKNVTNRMHRRFDWTLLIVSLFVLAFFRLILAPGLEV